MSYSNLSNLGPARTPKAVKALLTFTILIAILSAAAQTVMDQFNLSPGPQEILSLSWNGIKNYYFWQFFTFLFVQEVSPYGLSLPFLINLGFSCYVLWVLGTALVEVAGSLSFLRLFFISGIGASLAALAIMPITGSYSNLYGNAPSLLALLTVWGMIYSENEIYLFFLIPIKAKWLVVGVFAATLLLNLVHFDFLSLIYYSSGIFIGYLFATTAWSRSSPFAEMQKVDLFFINLGNKIRLNTPSWINQSKTAPQKRKIVDIETGKPLENDDAFVDAMLAKISKHGESSMSWQEKKRLQQISERKRQK